MIRNDNGILVDGHHITPIVLRAEMKSILDIDDKRLDNIFDPKDHMNVSNAVSLLSHIHELALHYDTSPNNLNSKGIALLGHFVGFFVQPFTKIELSLSTQLEYLSAAAHMMFVLFRKNRTSFCPGQLYYDIQSTIKSIYFCVVKQQELDINSSFYIIQAGTDRLENQFGIYRLMHNSRNFDILQLSQRASTSVETTRILGEYPDLDRGHTRLKIRGVGVDHLNTKTWEGNVCVKDVSALTCWNLGRRLARNKFKQYNVDFEEHLDISALKQADIDLLRPFGSYIGLDEASLEPPSSTPAPPPPVDGAFENEDPDIDGLEELEDLLPEAGSGNLNYVHLRDGESNWLMLSNGKKCHKSSAVRYLLSTEDGLKSTDRTERVKGMSKIRTFSQKPLSASLTDDSLLGDLFFVNKHVSSFLRIDNHIVLVIIKVTII